jgi:hypothetical protein
VSLATAFEMLVTGHYTRGVPERIRRRVETLTGDENAARSQASPVPGRAASWRERPRDAGPRPPGGWKFTERVAEFRYLGTTPLAGSAPTQPGRHAQ